MDELKSLTFYKSFYEAIKNLDEKQRLQIYDAIFQYQFDDIEIEFDDPILKSFWILIQPNIDASNVKKLAGAKGGRIKKSKTQASLPSKTKASLQKKSKLASSLLTKQNESEEEEEEEVEEEVEEEAEAEISASASAEDEVFTFYVNNINQMPTPREVEIIESYENDTPHELILFAMEKAVENKARSLGYIKAILNNWSRKGITTLAEAKEEAKVKQGAEPMQDVWSRFLMNKEAKDGAG